MEQFLEGVDMEKLAEFEYSSLTVTSSPKEAKSESKEESIDWGSIYEPYPTTEVLFHLHTSL